MYSIQLYYVNWRFLCHINGVIHLFIYLFIHSKRTFTVGWKLWTLKEFEQGTKWVSTFSKFTYKYTVPNWDQYI